MELTPAQDAPRSHLFTAVLLLSFGWLIASALFSMPAEADTPYRMPVVEQQ